MLKRKTLVIVEAFLIFVAILLFINKGYASENGETDKKVTITSDAKDINDTQEILFRVQDNPNIVAGKIAPGCKAVAEVEIKTKKEDSNADVRVSIDDANLNKQFKLTTKIDDEYFISNSVKTIKFGDNVLLRLELEWIGDELDVTNIGVHGGSIRIPVNIKVTQKI